MIDSSASSAAFRGCFGLEYPFPGAAGGFCPSVHQCSPRQVKVDKPDRREHLCGVFRYSLVAHLGVTELALDGAERMLDPCADRKHPVIEALVRPGQRMWLAGLERYSPELAGLASQTFELVVDVTLVAEHRLVVFVQQVRQLTSEELAGVTDTVCTSPELTSAPTWTFMPKYHCLAFFV